MNMKKYLAEFVGTAILVLIGCGSAVFLGTATNGGHLAVALAFGLAIVATSYVIGNISGCHINPAVSLAALINKGITALDFAGYLVAQFLGALAGAGLIQQLALLSKTDLTGALGSNGFGTIGMWGAIIVEIVLTFIFVLTILGVTTDKTKSSVAGIVIGLTLTLVHIIGIPLTGTSVNPARSFGPAILVGGKPLTELWVFLLAPLAGAALAALLFKWLTKSKKKA